MISIGDMPLNQFKRNGCLLFAIALVWTWVHTLFWSNASSGITYDNLLFGVNADWLASVAASTVALVAWALSRALFRARREHIAAARLSLVVCIIMLAGLSLLVAGSVSSLEALRVAGYLLTGLGSGSFMFAIGRAMVGLGNLEIILSVFAGLAVSAALCIVFEAMDQWLVTLCMFAIPFVSFPLLNKALVKQQPDELVESPSRQDGANLRTLTIVMLVSAFAVGLTVGFMGGFGGQGATISLGSSDVVVNRYLINLIICVIALVVLLALGTSYLKSLVALVIGAGALLVANSIFGAGIGQVTHIASLCLFTSLLWSSCGICTSTRHDVRFFAFGIALYQVGQIVGVVLFSMLNLAGQSLPESISLLAAFALLTAGAIILANTNRLSIDSVTSAVDTRQQALAVAAEFGLTEREAEIFSLMVDGLDVEDISNQLFITQGTVRTHTKRIYAKLDVHSKKEALALVKGN